ncbi:hypothetical protein ASC66_11980 [Leifsonia sp. Root4]|nr:hypothetical protein ASC66_11980 [Leifsonia sp. Root4]
MKEPARVAVSLELPDLGVLPVADPPLTDAESEKARLEQAEEAWQQLLVRYPTAVRPEVSFGYVTDETRVEIMRACLSAAGLPIDEGRDADGHVVSIGTSTTNEAEAIAQYSCVTAHPTRIVWAGPNEAERGWFYDYLTEFSAPCLAANGIETEPPPTREEFIATWPNQGWYPAVGMSADAAWDASLEAACPSANGTIADILAAHDTRR